ncbi:hypothetical protein GCM10007880_68030 [Mesorhizobium amorphae]|nr:hypothetical protein GCM10007880_68030 [Mesorhizobium amorphae]
MSYDILWAPWLYGLHTRAMISINHVFNLYDVFNLYGRQVNDTVVRMT